MFILSRGAMFMVRYFHRRVFILTLEVAKIQAMNFINGHLINVLLRKNTILLRGLQDHDMWVEVMLFKNHLW